MKQLLALLVLVGCNQSDQSKPTIILTEIESEIAPTTCGNEDPQQIIEVNGTGLALLDFDNDDDLDLFVVNASEEPCRLYENISDGSIVFKDVTKDIGINIQDKMWCNGVAVGDVNGDGFDDLYITRHGPNVLLINNEGTSFKDATQESGVGDTHWGTSARFGDLDGDEDLDLYVCNYLEFDFDAPPQRAKYKGQSVLGGPHGMTPQKDVVYENIGGGIFKEVTEQWGFSNETAFSLNAAILDFTGDGLQDVFVGNDSMSNLLFVNTGETPIRFKNIGLKTGVSANGDGAMQATMGIAIADVNGNSRPDIFTTNFSSDTNTLHINDASGFFDDRTNKYGLGLVSRTLLGWTCGFHDFDLDGDEDLFVVNGHVYPEATMETMDSSRNQPVLLLERMGSRFERLKLPGEYRDRAAVFGDLDNDGDTDVVVAQRNGEIRMLRNDSLHDQPFTIELHGQCLGAKLEILYRDGSKSTRWITDGFGFQSSSSTQKQLFAKPISSIEVTWPDGIKQAVQKVPANGLITIKQQ